jgi:pimeloyl-ACP methyl ester carboxylesterase
MTTSMLRIFPALIFGAAATLWAAGVETGSVTAPDGVRIVYDVRSKGDTTLLFVHCFSCDRTFWRDQADAFADRYRVVTLDLAGHGESGKGRKTWTILGLAGDVRLVADKLKLKRIILVGHSMGGPVSLEAARLMPGRVIGVIAVDTMHDAELRIAPEMAQSIAGKLKADFPGTMAGFIGSMFGKTADPAVREWVEKRAQAADPAVAVALMLDFPNLDLKKMFAAAGVPIRAINAKPPMAPPTNIEGNRKYADYDAALIDDTGHFVQLERPKEFNQRLAQFAAALAKGA